MIGQRARTKVQFQWTADVIVHFGTSALANENGATVEKKKF